MNPSSISLIFPIGSTGLIDVEVYQVSDFYHIPHSSEELAENSYIDACFKYDAERVWLAHGKAENERMGKG